MSSLRCSKPTAASASGMTGRGDPGRVPAGDRPAAEHGPAAVQYGRPRVVQGARLLAQGPPPAVQLLKGVLHDVFGGGHVTHHQHGQPDQFQVMRPEQLGHVPAWVIRRAVIGSLLRPWPRAADDIRRISFHTWETFRSRLTLRCQVTNRQQPGAASGVEDGGRAGVDGGHETPERREWPRVRGATLAWVRFSSYVTSGRVGVPLDGWLRKPSDSVFADQEFSERSLCRLSAR